MELKELDGLLLVRLSEWERAELRLPSLTESDRILAAALGQGNAQLTVEELREVTRVRATSWIGVVRFEAFEIRVEPKYVGGNLGVIEMLDYVNGFRSLARFPRTRQLAFEGKSLFDLVAFLLAQESDRLVRDGLLQDYVQREESLPALRGRLLPLEQATQHYGQLTALACRYDEFETDVDENRLLAAALTVAAPQAGDQEVRRRVRLMRSALDEVCDASALDWEWVDGRVEYHRRNAHYQPAHDYARLVLRALSVSDIYEASALDSFTFLLDMNRLFEQFVTRVLADGLAGSQLRVLPQKRDHSSIVEEASGRPYRTVVPDILILGRSSDSTMFRIPVDAKYKLYQAGKIEPADIYQLFFYAYAFDRPTSSESRLARAFILYPSTDQWHQIRLRAQAREQTPTARLVGWGVDVHRTLEAIETGAVASLPFVAGIREAVAAT